MFYAGKYFTNGVKNSTDKIPQIDDLEHYYVEMQFITRIQDNKHKT